MESSSSNSVPAVPPSRAISAIFLTIGNCQWPCATSRSEVRTACGSGRACSEEFSWQQISPPATAGGSDMRNILIATTQVPFTKGGAELHAEGLRRALCAAGYNAEIVALPFKWYPPAEIM